VKTGCRMYDIIDSSSPNIAVARGSRYTYSFVEGKRSSSILYLLLLNAFNIDAFISSPRSLNAQI
jgi:hypothetical protein